MAGVEMRYLTNAARHRQTIQRMLDNGVEVVVAVRKDRGATLVQEDLPTAFFKIGSS